MQTMAEVGDRIRSRMPHGMTQRRLADSAGMTPDALSRALNGQRGLSPGELARIAQTLGADTHWLITGVPDPFRVDVAARHPRRGRRSLPGATDDQSLLARVAELYRAALPQGPPASAAVPREPEDLRRRLGDGFAHQFVERVESALGIDVIRLPDLTTDYSLRIGDRGVILLRTLPNWARSNWSLAHELAHLALGHHDGNARVERNEAPADQFAAALLLPESSVRAIDWEHISAADVARFLWDAGVSAQALRARLAELELTTPIDVDVALKLSTRRLLRAHRASLALPDWPAAGDPVTLQEQLAANRRFPLPLLAALQDRVEDGEADPMLLAWLLDVPVDDIVFPEPDEAAESAAYERMLADRPDIRHWEGLLDPTANR